MKKIKLLVALGVCGLVLGACGNEEESNTPEKQAASQVDVAKEESKAVESESKNEDFYFKDDELVINDLEINITDTKIIPVGETGNEYGEKPVIAFWYDTTNLTEKELDPLIAWIAVFSAFQDNNPDSVNELNVASLPDEKFLDTQSEVIKQNGTVANAIAYELDDDITPVELKANQGIDGKDLGEKTIEVK